uniref:Tetratricopeptide repeat domain protein n=1 Tax=uncultured prokaryote TaxID=198431 RepID=H5SKW0_9ZZZZ|nr:tetratricopeptide repeat domain protein [uncultured prokaryote]
MTPKERIAELKQELASNPGSRQFYQLGELLRREGQLAEAVTVLRQGLTHHPRYVAAWVSLGRALLDLQQLPEAQTAFREALALDPQNPVAWRLLGEALLGLGERGDALRAFEQALTLVPGDEVLEEAVASLKAELSTPAPPVRAEPPLAAPFAEPFAESLAPPPPSGGDLFPLEELPLAAGEPDAVFSLPLEPPPPPAADFLWEPPLSLEETATQAEAPPQGPEAATLEPFGEAAAREEPVPELPPLPEKSAGAVAPPPAPGPQPVLPTLADARAAVHRGDLTAAAEMLRQLLAANPEHQEAADLLALVEDMMAPLPPEEPKLSPREKKIAALQRFLASVTLARERLSL